METAKSLDESEIIAALLADAHASTGVFNTRDLRLTQQCVRKRFLSEGVGFLTKTLPRLGKHIDHALTGSIRLDPAIIRFAADGDSQLPRFLGELLERIFHTDGSLLPDPDAKCVKHIRQILYSFYKYEIPYDEMQEQKVIDAFKQAEKDLTDMQARFAFLHSAWHSINQRKHLTGKLGDLEKSFTLTDDDRSFLIIREARALLERLFWSFDPTDIYPQHGPGVVATKQRLWDKYRWTNVSSRITDLYPFDAYFCASLGHVCDVYNSFDAVSNTDHSAQVLLVPKDSRGPRLISCEPVDFQWVQQGLRKAIYRLVEEHPISRWNVFFTDQGPNQRGALLGSSSGRYATLDLKEASDRVHLDLVRLLFPERLTAYLECSRSTSTVLPSGEKLPLLKFAPMGSALCFPIMALTIWALLTAGAPDADTRESILVYGDDVIVPTAYAGSAMTILESFGLKINRDKSCTQGLFRESCGVDAFKGVNVTPVRFRTVWDESPRPDTYTSWISYANAFWDRQYTTCHEYIVTRLQAIYGPIPSADMTGLDAQLSYLSLDRRGQVNPAPFPYLRGIPSQAHLFKRRFNQKLQKLEFKVRVIKNPSIERSMDGWSMLLRWFTEGQKQSEPHDDEQRREQGLFEPQTPFLVSRYTKRGQAMLVQRWR